MFVLTEGAAADWRPHRLTKVIGKLVVNVRLIVKGICRSRGLADAHVFVDNFVSDDHCLRK